MRRNVVLTAVLLAGAVLILPSAAAIAQGVDMGPSECFSCRDAPSVPTYSAPQAQPQPSQADIAAQQARQQRLNEAHTANQQGVAFYNTRDWAKALTSFQEAAAKNPDDPTIKANLAGAQAAVAEAQTQLENQQRDKAAAQHMQEAIQGFAQTLKTAPAAGGLEFDGGNSSSSPGAGGLDFTATVAATKQTAPPQPPAGDPKVVDARNVPSGLSKAVEDAISGAYRDAPSGVSDRVRKGFQAVASNDWKVAKAWFEDALNRDPGNAALTRMVVLADYALGGGQAATPAATTRTAPSASPRPAEIDAFFRNFREGRAQAPTDNVRNYVRGLSNDDFKRLLWEMKPVDSDMEYLFDLNTPHSPQSQSSAR